MVRPSFFLNDHSLSAGLTTEGEQSIRFDGENADIRGCEGACSCSNWIPLESSGQTEAESSRSFQNGSELRRGGQETRPLHAFRLTSNSGQATTQMSRAFQIQFLYTTC